MSENNFHSSVGEIKPDKRNLLQRFSDNLNNYLVDRNKANVNREEFTNNGSSTVDNSNNADVTLNKPPMMLLPNGEINPLWQERYGTPETADDRGDANDGGGVLPEAPGLVPAGKAVPPPEPPAVPVNGELPPPPPPPPAEV